MVVSGLLLKKHNTPGSVRTNSRRDQHLQRQETLVPSARALPEEKFPQSHQRLPLQRCKSFSNGNHFTGIHSACQSHRNLRGVVIGRLRADCRLHAAHIRHSTLRPAG